MRNLIVRSRRTRVATALATAAVSMAVLAVPASAQQNEQDGLVNLNLQNVAITVPVQVAANVCIGEVNVLAVDEGSLTEVACETNADQFVSIENNPAGSGPGNANRPARQ